MFLTTIRDGERAVLIPAGDAELRGTLSWPVHPSGVVLFAHDTGSGQYCPRDHLIAWRLRHEGIATLRFDLLNPREAGNPARAFDTAMLARRIEAVAQWLASQPEVIGLPMGLCGSGTGAAAAMMAAGSDPHRFSALVARGAQTDQAEFFLARIEAPTLLLVGGLDERSLAENQRAMEKLSCPSRLIAVPGATHRFEERGALEQVAACVAEWFVHYLSLQPAWAVHHHHGRMGCAAAT
jgi:putative phosphoribosyl transferase